MKKKLFFVGMAALLLSFGLVLAACPSGGDSGGKLIIKINTHDKDGTTYYVGPVWSAGGGWSASGYRAKSAVADADGVVTVEYTSEDITNVWGENCYIAWHTTDFILAGARSNKEYKMDAGTIKLDYDGKEDPSL